MKSISLCPQLAALAVVAATFTPSHAAIIHSIDWGTRTVSAAPDYQASPTDPLGTASTTAIGVTASGVDLASLTPGLSRINNNDNQAGVGPNGNWLTIQSGAGDFTVNSQATLDQQYWTFTVTANAGSTLNLSSLDFSARRATGGAATDRDLEIWAATNGAAMTYTAGGFLFRDDDVTSNRTNVAGDPYSIDLSGAQFQGINSITFRVYNPGTTAFHGIDMGDVVLNGTITAVPEPAITLLGSLGVLAFLRRRRA